MDTSTILSLGRAFAIAAIAAERAGHPMSPKEVGEASQEPLRGIARAMAACQAALTDEEQTRMSAIMDRVELGAPERLTEEESGPWWVGYYKERARALGTVSLASLRERAHMTQAKLAEAAGVAQTAVSAWERGARRPGADSVAALAKALGATENEVRTALGI